MRIIPPTLFVRLRQEMAASRINKLLYSVNSHRFEEGAAISYMSLEADRLKEERLKEQSSTLDGVDIGMNDWYFHSWVDLLTLSFRFRGTLPLCGITAPPSILVLQSRSSA